MAEPFTLFTYSPEKVSELLKTRSYMATTVLGEWLMTDVFPLVVAMQDEIRGSAAKASKAETDRDLAEQERDQALATARKLRDGNSGYAELVATLQTIARNPKGSAKLAAEALAKVGEAAK